MGSMRFSLTSSCKITVRSLVRSVSDLQSTWPEGYPQQWLASCTSERGKKSHAGRYGLSVVKALLWFQIGGVFILGLKR